MGFEDLRDKLDADYIKKVLADMALDQAVKFLARDPEKNLVRLLDFAERISFDKAQRESVRVLRQRCAGDPKIMAQVKRLAFNPKATHKFMSNWVVNAILLGAPRRKNLGAKLGINIPTLILVDPTSACNLRCTGCWAGEYAKTDRLEPELFNRILNEAKELGIYWIVLSGGEPFAYPHLLDVLDSHPDMGFMIYTNGTLIGEGEADKLARMGNVSPAFSLEGWEEDTDQRRGNGVFNKVTHAMDLLRERGVLFGASVTVTRNNVDVLFSDEFVDFLIDKGCFYVWSFHYIPIGRDPDLSLMITTEQRRYLAGRVPQIRGTKPILIADFWNDGNFTGGCIAGGRTYFHINAAGDIEPCAFVHFATDNIRNTTIKEALRSPLFAAYQKHQPFCQNHLAPCPIIDNPQALRDIVVETGAHPTHAGAQTVLTGEVAEFLDRQSANWRKTANEIQAERGKTAVGEK